MKTAILMSILALTNIMPNENIEDNIINIQSDSVNQNSQIIQSELDNLIVDGLDESKPIKVVIKYCDDYKSSNNEVDTFEQVVEQRKELVNYFAYHNQRVFDTLDLNEYCNYSMSKMGPYLSFEYNSLDNFKTSDLECLKNTYSIEFE